MLPAGRGRRDDEEEERPQPCSSIEHGDRPSPKELEELELLNRALEKALKVRKSILKTPLEVQGATGQKWAGEAHAPKKAEEQQVPVPAEDVPECRKMPAEAPPSLQESLFQELQCHFPGWSLCPDPSWPGAWDAAQSWCCETFLKLLLLEFCSPKLIPSPAEIEEELRGLQDVPFHLRQYVEAVPADPPTLQEEYESLLTLEGLQTTVSQCLQKLQLLQTALESQLRLRPDCTGDVGSCSPACVPARGQTCASADVLAVPLLYYSSLQELSDLFASKLQVSMLHQEIALQKVMMAELLPVLEPRPFLEGSAGLLRAIHSQLCEGGRRFPVLVRDELLD
ncbi:hypothetical protein DUI87_05580 [Hirundo rustica rustica]|uniref:Uncharacterized protein n=1 Tax=Hirundo rustica rustica TaxID=333673 RepID=A0A3M0KYY2_HIRRU|nr:hypothetical protein DUI87_05580 [Hirundo rustica rustica]